MSSQTATRPAETRQMRIGILQTGQNRAELAAFDEYPVLFDRLLTGAETAGQPRWCTLETYRVLDGVFPNDINACDGYIVTGSAAGVYEQHDWIAPLMQFIRACHAAGLPLLGICFGHQAIARALGGEVVKWDGGWGVGVQEMRLVHQPGFMPAQTDRFSLIYFHQDQVTKLPDGAMRLASSDFCENGGFTLGDTILCLQGHPEFEAEYSAALLAAIADKVGTDRAEAAAASLNTQTDAPAVAGWIKQFFTAARQQASVPAAKAG